MRQYLTLLEEIKKKGALKPAAREGMPGTLSLFGYQFRHDLAEGFPLLTTKKMAWKNIVTELLWFLRGDTNIKYLVDNGCNIWNEDAYNYYLKVCKQYNKEVKFKFNDFVEQVKDGYPVVMSDVGYKLGDCGFQYGKVWRDWEGEPYLPSIDQIANVIKSLKETPESRRHIVTAIDPAHDKDLALYWCHAMFQFNCRPISAWYKNWYLDTVLKFDLRLSEVEAKYEELNLPKYYLDCQLYQRSADVVLGVPFNIASYALLTHIIAKIVNMVPGEFIHTFGDVHIYENHMDAVEEQLKREPRSLPILKLSEDVNWENAPRDLKGLHYLDTGHFRLDNYDPYPKIEAKLSTGLK
jgi:thymidylate synthase